MSTVCNIQLVVMKDVVIIETDHEFNGDEKVKNL